MRNGFVKTWKVKMISKITPECISFMNGLKAQRIHYLEEGTYEFSLKDGRQFTVYASPYTPECNGYAFAYGKDEDKFNQGVHSVPENVDILMTHGPPSFPTLAGFKLDFSESGKHCGCEKLTSALQRASPRLHCFGHIHEGRGAVHVCWNDAKDTKQFHSTSVKVLEEDGIVLEATKEVKGKQSLLVNAAMNGPGTGWLVDLEA